MRMTAYHAEEAGTAHVFAELTFQASPGSNDLIVLLCDDRPVGLCVSFSRIILSEAVDWIGSLASDIVRNWVEDLERVIGEQVLTREAPDMLDDLIYGYIAAMERPRNILMGADVGRHALIELRFDGGLQLLFDASDLLAAMIPGHSTFVSSRTPDYLRDPVADWVRTHQEAAVDLEHRPLADLVDRHIA